MLKDVFKAKSFSDAMGYLFKRPGWKPDEVMIKDNGKGLSHSGPTHQK